MEASMEDMIAIEKAQSKITPKVKMHWGSKDQDCVGTDIKNSSCSIEDTVIVTPEDFCLSEKEHDRE